MFVGLVGPDGRRPLGLQVNLSVPGGSRLPEMQVVELIVLDVLRLLVVPGGGSHPLGMQVAELVVLMVIDCSSWEVAVVRARRRSCCLGNGMQREQDRAHPSWICPEGQAGRELG